MSGSKVIVVGGGAAGFFAAVTAAEAGAQVTLLERGSQFLSKVRISGGGRCNVTHACFEVREFVRRYPRGGKELIGPLHRFQASDTVAWFQSRGVELKTEADGRMFPTTDSSQTIVDCLMQAARDAGVKLCLNSGVERAGRVGLGGVSIESAGRIDTPLTRTSANLPTKPLTPALSPSEVEREMTGRLQGLKARTPVPGTLSPSDGGRGCCEFSSIPVARASGFEVVLTSGVSLQCDRLLLATGGCRSAALGQLAVSLGHTLEAPVPSLFTVQIDAPWLGALAGVAVENAEVSVPHTSLKERGPLLVTHWGLSGPVILRLSAWGARELSALDYKFPLLVNWLPHLNPDQLLAEFQLRRESQGAKLVINAPIAPLTARLWEALVLAADLSRESRWASLSRAHQQRLIQQLSGTGFAVAGKSLNKDEFVTCGGVRLSEVNFKTMESRVCPGLHFAGELLDLDGITGGFNFQAAWTTGWIAGQAMAAA